MLYYPNNTIEKLGFNKILQLITDACTSTLGKDRVSQMSFYSDISLIDKLLSETLECKLILESGYDIPTLNFYDLSRECQLLQIVDVYIEPNKLHQLHLFLLNIQKIYFWFNENKIAYPNIYNIISQVAYEKKIAQIISEKIDDNGQIKSNASDTLLTLRKELSILQRQYENQFKQCKIYSAKQGYLADEGESVRNDRWVLCIAAEHKRKVKGIIHDESATGKSVFIEPIEIVDIANDIISNKIAEQREIVRIIKQLCIDLAPYAQLIEMYQQIAAKLDHTRAKAIVATAMQANKPELNTKQIHKLDQAYHPLLWYEAQHNKSKIVPFYTTLNSKKRILLISGPNAGGKTVVLKTFGLLQLMLQTGMLIPVASTSNVCLFHQLLIELGDEQSIENQLSTYSSKLKNMRYFVEHANLKTLLLMDEVGTGTDPNMGGAIAEALLEELIKKNVFAVLNTHYSNLKLLSNKYECIENGAMLFDLQNLKPLYELQIGKAGSSYAFEMAQTQGLQKNIIDRAKNKVNKNERSYDQVLGDIIKEKNTLKNQQNHYQQLTNQIEKKTIHLEKEEHRLNQKRQQLLAKEKELNLNTITLYEKKFQALYQQFLKEIKTKEEYIAIFKTLQEEKNKSSNNGESFITKKDEKPKNPKSIAINDTVKIINTNETGIVTEIRSKKAVVLFGDIKSLVPMQSLEIATQSPNKIASKKTSTPWIEKQSTFSDSVDVRGMNSDEALQTIEMFLDTAIMLQSKKIKIIHGKGTGTLRNAIRANLKTNKQVKTFYSAIEEFGGEGITNIELI